VIPHPPQFARSVCGLMHRSVQNDHPVGQSMLHTPALQPWPPPHAFMHAPQCAGFVITSTHCVPQSICPVGHEA
jgi:hypothetical protein